MRGAFAHLRAPLPSGRRGPCAIDFHARDPRVSGAPRTCRSRSSSGGNDLPLDAADASPDREAGAAALKAALDALAETAGTQNAHAGAAGAMIAADHDRHRLERL